MTVSSRSRKGVGFEAALQEHAGLVLVCALFLAFGILRLNDLSLYTPHSAQYLIWGNSIAHGKGWVDDTQPVPQCYVTHAPLYPVLIAPVELLFPLSLVAVKVATLLWGVLAVVFLYVWLKILFGTRYALAGVLIFILNPLTLLLSTEVLSEAPFVAMMLFGFLLAEMVPERSSTGRPLTVWMAACAAAAALCREPGIALVLAFTVVFMIRKERRQAATVLILGAAVLGLWYLRNQFWIGPLAPFQTGNVAAVFHHYVTPPDVPIINELVLRAWIRLGMYSKLLGGMLLYPLYATRQFSLEVMSSPLQAWLGGFMHAASYLIMAILIPAMIGGLVLDVRRSSSGAARLLFLIFYLCIILLFPVDDIRFLYPLLPLMIFYVIGGIRPLLERASIAAQVGRPLIVAAVSFVLMAPNISSINQILKLNLLYRRSPVEFAGMLAPIKDAPPVFTQPFPAMGEWIRANVPDTAIIASPSKDLAVVVGTRKVWQIDQGAPVPVVESILRDNRIGYLVTPLRRESIRAFECLLHESKRLWFERLYRVANLELYRVHSRLREPDPANADADDLLSPAFKAGRELLMSGKYDAARSVFAEALRSDSTSTDMLYQMVLASAFLGDSAGAQRYYAKLSDAPQDLGVALPARQALQAAGLLALARRQAMHESKAVEVFRVAALYWKLGYPRRAAEIMNEVLDADSSYFVGLLWGLHFNLQVGDTARARGYLGILQGIDSSNPVVIAFRRVLAIGDSLRSASSPEEKSKLHLSLARIYQQIELNDEAIDEAERALRYAPDVPDALLVMARMYERKSALPTALAEYHAYLQARPDDTAARARVDSLSALRGAK